MVSRLCAGAAQSKMARNPRLAVRLRSSPSSCVGAIPQQEKRRDGARWRKMLAASGEQYGQPVGRRRRREGHGRPRFATAGRASCSEPTAAELLHSCSCHRRDLRPERQLAPDATARHQFLIPCVSLHTSTVRISIGERGRRRPLESVQPSHL